MKMLVSFGTSGRLCGPSPCAARRAGQSQASASAASAIRLTSKPSIRIRICSFRLVLFSVAGVYQIGEVQARSWCFIGTSGGIFMPKRTAS